MKTIKIIASVLIVSSFIAGCVSNKKYQSAVDQQNKLQQQNQALKTELASLTDEFNAVKYNTSQTIEEKEAELNKKADKLKQREEKLKELEDLVNDQQLALQSLHQEVCSALKCFTPDELSVEVRDGKLYVSLSDKLLFKSGSDNVNKRGKEAIGMLAAVLANSDLEIMVEGHTDNIPINTSNYEDNWDLSVHRATSVTRIMIENGISPDKVIASGRGEYKPLANNETKDGRQLNRRTEIVLSPKLDKLWELADQDISLTNTK